MELLMKRVVLWNDFMMDHLSEVNLQSRDDRLLVIASFAGQLFAELSGHDGEHLYKQIGAAAFMSLNTTTEKLFFRTELVTA